MTARALDITGAWEFWPEVLSDDWCTFVETYSAPDFAHVVGHPMALGHMTVSVARAGLLRGIHVVDVPPGCGKLVTCVSGAVWDVVVDLRVGSETFGRWAGVLLDDTARNAVYWSEGLGHGYLSLEDGSVLVYLHTQPYVAERERRIYAFDPVLAISWPVVGRSGAPLEHVIGRKDRAAPTLAQAVASSMLPSLGTAQLLHPPHPTT